MEVVATLSVKGIMETDRLVVGKFTGESLEWSLSLFSEPDVAYGEL